MKVQLIQPEKWLFEKINVKKKRLKEISSTMALTDEVVKCSQELDRLMNLLQRQKLHLLDHVSTININLGKRGE